MFCTNCGQEIADEAVICPHCGVATANYHAEPKSQEKNVLAYVGFGLAFVVSIAGLICSILAYKKADELGGDGKGFAKAGIIISAVEIVAEIVSSIIYLCIYGAYYSYIFENLIQYSSIL